MDYCSVVPTVVPMVGYVSYSIALFFGALAVRASVLTAIEICRLIKDIEHARKL